MDEMVVLETRHGRFLVRPYYEGDESAILEGWKRAFGKEMSPEEWRWKYAECPGGFRCLLCLSENGEVAVHYAAQVYPAVFRGERILGLHLTDTFSVPAYRWAIGGKHGLLVKVGLYFLKTYLESFPVEENFRLPDTAPKAAFHYGFPGERHFRLGALLLHYRRFGPGTAYLIWRPGDLTDHPPETTGISALRSQDLWARDRAIEDLWLFIEREYRPFMVMRDWRYFWWRYLASPPGRRYVFFLRERGLLRKRLTAWAAGALSRKRSAFLTLLDIIARNEDELEGLLAEILGRLSAHGLACEVWLSGNHPWIGAFLRRGFRPAKEPLGIVPCTRIDRPGLSPDLGDDLLWTLGESDLF
ncbi:hypothetical protein [Thermosulfurimonas sp. F29]|uniref:hypothetical protein n=1 Tax=Thermosulfurimonas sp. F29 TaxID=2867247 RepID=UPI001C83EC61|nr:hypothetical protein [Thermosulfurimonas sp. F29]MBX6424244.1 hypothetical protein [Thermosulfurimonas sp. F29]